MRQTHWISTIYEILPWEHWLLQPVDHNERDSSHENPPEGEGVLLRKADGCLQGGLSWEMERLGALPRPPDAELFL